MATGHQCPARLARIGAVLVFALAALLYGLTVAPGVVLWDSGEFIASAFGLQVMHPPGAPLYILLGRAISMFAGAEHAALAVNLVSALSASLTAVFAYLILLRLARRLNLQSTASLGGAVVGALTLVVTDTFWFNAVEAEVYALATLFAAAIVWLALRWSDELREAGRAPAAGHPPASWRGHRYLVLIALFFGLAIGIHLMSILTYFFIAPIAFFTLVDRPSWSPARRVRNLLAAAAAAAVGFAVIYPGIVVTLPEVAAAAPLLALPAVAAALAAGLYLTRRKPLAHLALLCTAALLIGYSSYSVIPIRSAADPEIDLNDPETPAALVSYLKREQYGRTPLLAGPTYDDGAVNRDAFFPRRHSGEPAHLALYSRYASDADYFLRYQLGHMYARYFMWNFVGRAHDTQHARSATGFERARVYDYDTPSERASRNAYFGLPLLLGLIGLIYHVRADWRTALSLSALFGVMGVGLVVYLNEIPVTPRERDYIFVGSFLVFCMWIGLGAAACIQAASSWARHRRPAALAAAAALVLAVPGWMVLQNFADHDRSGNVAVRDLAYNFLMSVEKDAILITGGDNDTYPLWYLQAVEGVRRDVRIVCLPLTQTSWYAKQLKNQRAYDADPVPMSFTDDELEALRPVAWQPREISLPVDAAHLLRQSALRIAVEDTNGFESPMRWRLEGRPYREAVSYLTPADQVILDILATNAREGWGRPVYFGVNAPASDRLNLEPFLQREGLAFRVVPIRHDRPNGRVVSSIMTSRLDNFRLTHLADPDVYYADDLRSLVGFNYRLAFAQAADTLVDEGEPEAAERTLAAVMDAVPADTIPLHPFQAVTLGRTYQRLGDVAQVVSLVETARPRLLRELQFARNESAMQTSLQLANAMRGLLIEVEAYEEASRFSGELAGVLGDASLRQSPDELRRLHRGMPPS